MAGSIDPIRIANGQGFWGDWLEAPIQQLRRGPIDYLTLDYLAEVTMSIMQKQRARDSRAGYARDFVPMIEEVIPDLVNRNIRVIANAGGVNPGACVAAILDIVRARGFQGRVKIASVAGDDILGRIEDFISRGIEFRNMDSGEPLASVLSAVESANVYFGARPIAQALDLGATIVVTGRTTDSGLTLAPMIHQFGWRETDWDKLAAGTIAGHTIECGAQCTGGNCLIDWRAVPNLAGVGYPIVEAHDDGSFVVTKHDGTGGQVTVATVKEQLLYEMADPREYITPDCVADFTTIQLAQAGADRVAFSGIKGRPATDMFKVSISYSAGYKATGTLVYAWPDALDKARTAGNILRQRLDRLGLAFEEVLTEFVGAGACHGPLAGPVPADIPEVQLRFAVRASDRSPVERFTREIAPLVLNGPPTVTGFAGGRPKVEQIVAYWPALMPKSQIEPVVSLIEA